MENYSNQKRITRYTLLSIIDAAIKSRSITYAMELIEGWLEKYPGDLSVNLRLAKCEIALGNYEESKRILERLLALDPEYREAYEVYSSMLSSHSSKEYNDAIASIYALGGHVLNIANLPSWASVLRETYICLSKNDLDKMQSLLYQIMGESGKQIMVDLIHMRLSLNGQDSASRMNLAQLYQNRWPDCLQFKLCLADAQMDMGKETEAVNLLHTCVSDDVAGQVVKKIWGKDFRYLPLWPDKLELPFDMALPADVVASLGWNRLKPGDIQSTIEDLTSISDIASNQDDILVANNHGNEHIIEVSEIEEVDLESTKVSEVLNKNEEVHPLRGQSENLSTQGVGFQENNEDHLNIVDTDSQLETHENAHNDFSEIEKEFGKLSNQLGRSDVTKTDGRFPVYVLFSSRIKLEEKYGPQTSSVIIEEMKQLAKSIQKRPGWNAMVFLPDDQECVKWLGIDAVTAIDPWSLKLSLADLDNVLAKKGERIGSLMIVGDPEIVPFHALPNPTDDIDESVLSDNPYGTIDSNYFVPEWPVGRICGEANNDAGLLLQQLRECSSNHDYQDVELTLLERILAPFIKLVYWLKSNPVTKSKMKNLSSIGMTASIWRRASIAVYRPIGDANTLLVSPPVNTQTIEKNQLLDYRIGYFNLHGIMDGPDWYGQRDIVDSSSGPDYPTAIRPDDVVAYENSPAVIFSEACYGGYVISKNINDSMSLKFLSIGVKSLVGSTCVAYGSVNSPLIGADLLGYLFWKRLGEGYSTGESLMYAKIAFAKEMNRRQGFLDGEDQKTLLSFVLYGDPLTIPDKKKYKSKKIVRMQTNHSFVPIYDERGENQPNNITREALGEIKQTLEKYLPGIDDAEVHFSKQLFDKKANQKSSENDDSSVGMKKSKDTGNVVVTVSKQIKVAKTTHLHYARVTLDTNGKMVKLAISR